MQKRIRLLALGMMVCMMGQLAGYAAKQEVVYPEMKTASGLSRAFQNVSGFTPVTGWFANRMLRKELARHVDGRLQSKLTLFSGSDLLRGKAKHIVIRGQNVVVDDYIPLSDFSFENKDDMPLYVTTGSQPILLRPVHFKVSAIMTEQDMNRMLTSEKGRKLLTNMKISIPPFGPQYLDIVNPSVLLDGDKVVIESLMNTHGAPLENALPIKVSGKLAAEKSRLSLSDLDLQITGMPEEDTEAIEHLVEAYFSELVDLNHLKVDRHKMKIKIQKSELVDHRLHLDALVVVEPDKKALKKALARQK